MIRHISHFLSEIDLSAELIQPKANSNWTTLLSSKMFACFIVNPSFLDSLTFVNALRSAATAPVVILSAEQCAKLTSTGNTLSIDDRISSLLRQKSAADIVRVAEFEICREWREARIRGQPLRLTAKEFDILSLLVFNPKRVFTYEMIIDIVWHENFDFYSQRAVHHHVSNLKRKIRQISPEKEYIKSVYAVGYKFEP